MGRKKQVKFYEHKDLYEDVESKKMLEIINKKSEEEALLRKKKLKKQRIKNIIFNISVAGLTILMVVLVTLFLVF